MAHPKLVPIFFADDPDVDALTRFTQWIGTSSWLDEVGAEYGVGAGSVLGVVQKPTRAPAAISNAEIIDLLFAGIADGSIPQPPTGDAGEVLYMFHFTELTVIEAMSCQTFSGYHDSARRDGVELAYAVVAKCFDFAPIISPVEGRELIASHEIIEAATDPFPSNHPGFQLHDPTSSWLSLGAEVGDLCEGSPLSIWREAGFVTQRSWSNAAAAVGDPCVPLLPADRYANVVADTGGAIPRIEPGGKHLFGLAGWSTSSTAGAWMLSARSVMDGDSTLTLANDSLNAGGSTTLTVEVPATATKGTLLRLFVFSSFSQTDYQILPIRAIVDDPCSSFSGCDTCTAHPGCGFCATTGRCETEGASGSAESSCPASSFASWPGSCPGFCAAHSGSCTECASQPGCGACSAGGVTQCLEASHDYAEPQGADCAYADWSFTPAYCPQ